MSKKEVLKILNDLSKPDLTVWTRKNLLNKAKKLVAESTMADPCSFCNRTGNCQNCDGSGECPDCNGSGQCENCDGEGEVSVDLTK